MTAADTLARLCCQGCGARPKIVLLVRDRLNAGGDSLALWIEADAWRLTGRRLASAEHHTPAFAPWARSCA
ncbi:hypothetical protein [Falsiroseomonas sp. E2-1-a20]|uniref:hypothetical protein n=1 Tax=Falsiroseomonas sp. E2-1-a20 TaxID=3239300 RepID=UPI003F351808